jgi:hypothetical protein
MKPDHPLADAHVIVTSESTHITAVMTVGGRQYDHIIVGEGEATRRAILTSEVEGRTTYVYKLVPVAKIETRTHLTQLNGGMS